MLGTCHSERSEESHPINKLQILHGVYPEPKIETLRFTQGDSGEGFRMTDILILLLRHSLPSGERGRVRGALIILFCSPFSSIQGRLNVFQYVSQEGSNTPLLHLKVFERTVLQKEISHSCPSH